MIIALVSSPELDRVRRELTELDRELRPGQGLMAFGLDAEPLLGSPVVPGPPDPLTTDPLTP
jgi:hypothetical protein